MTARRILPSVVALLLGVAAALAVAACGEGTKGGIPAADADDLKSQFEDVQQAVDDGRCNDVGPQRTQVDRRIDSLPQSVDNRLQERLRAAADRLRQVALEECAENREKTQTEETTAPPPETVTTVVEPEEPRTETTPPTQPPAETEPPAQTEPPPAETQPETEPSGGTPPGEDAP